MPFSIRIMPTALAEWKAIRAFDRRRLTEAVEELLADQPTATTRNRKLLFDPRPSFACEPPIWELRVGDFRVFHDVDEAAQVVFVRAVREKLPHRTTEEAL